MEIKHRTQLPELMKSFKLPMIAVEVGTAEAYNAYDLLKNGIEKLYVVDNYATIPNQKGDGGSPQSWHDKNYSDAVERLKEFGDKVVFLRGLSSEMAQYVPDNSLGLVYLDGDHSYEGVMTDLVNWFPKLVKGGVMAGHDYLSFQYGIFEAVHHFVEKIGRNDYKILTIPEHKEQDAGFYFFKS